MKPHHVSPGYILGAYFALYNEIILKIASNTSVHLLLPVVRERVVRKIFTKLDYNYGIERKKNKHAQDQAPKETT
jgi:hypothetical protein